MIPAGATAPAAAPDAAIAPQTLFGPYRIEAEIGRGGMGVVYRAAEVSLGRPVALKVLLAGERATAEQASRFLREARSAANLSHPNIVPVYAAGTEGGIPYFAMELVKGTSLEILGRSRPDPRESARIVRDVARALAYSHRQGIVHRDVKPANILLDRQGNPKVTDFGLAKVLGDRSGLTQEGTALGTPAYMSPEQASGKTLDMGPLSDVYSLGAVFFEVLAGRPPFLAETPLHLMAKVQSEEPPPLVRIRPDVPRDLQTICFKALEKDPARRYASMDAFADDLNRFLEGDSILARPPSALERARRAARRWRAALLVALVTFLATSVVATVASMGRRGAEPATPPPAPAVSAEDRDRAILDMDLGREFLRRAETAHLTENPANRRVLLEQSLAAFEAACAADPERPEGFLERGRVLSHLQRYEEALGAFAGAIALNPDLTDAYYGRVQIRFKRYFQTRLIGGRESSDALRRLIEDDLEAIERIGAKPEKYHCGRGLLLHLDGDEDGALEAMGRAVAANESFADAWAGQGNIHLLRALSNQGRMNKEHLRLALEAFDAAWRLSGGVTEYRANRAQVLLALGRTDEALADADAVVAAVPDRPFPYLLRAQIQRVRGNEEAYDADMDRADALPAENLDMHLAVAGSLIAGAVQSGDLKRIRPKDVHRALKHLDALFARNPERTDIRGIRGLANLLAGRRDEAVADFKAYLEAYPDAQLAPAIRSALTLAEAGMTFSLDAMPLTFQTAMAALKSGREEEAETLLRRILRRTVADGTDDAGRAMTASTHFELARILARRIRRGDADPAAYRALRREALEHLEKAFDAGFDDAGELDDRAFDPLRADERFQALPRK